MTDSVQLLRAYAERGDEAAFRELVSGYIDLVYSTALRRVGGDAELAHDVTQTVFTDLARKAGSLGEEVMLGGWLHHHTGFVASSAVRSERRRQAREQQAAEMNALQDSSDSLWQQLTPFLDETIDSLETPDRQAIVLRFFERRDFRSVGVALGISDDAAQKRVSRALEKLRTLLVQRGVALSVTLLAGLMAGKVVSAAPVGLAASVSKAALAAVASGAGITVALMKLMSSLSFKVALGTVALVVVAVLLSRPPANMSQATASANENSPQPVAGPVATTATGAQAVAADGVLGEFLASTNKVALTIVAADGGESVPMVTIDYQLREGTKSLRKKLVSTRLGVCEVPVPRDTVTTLLLTCQIDGFADTSLRWRVDRGEKIPEEYTLRLTRPVQIGGHVVDAAGQPVAGARISFRALSLSAGRESETSTEFHAEGYAMGITDAQGQWTLNRLAPEVFRRVNRCSANHPEHGSSELVSIAGDPETEKQMLAGTHVFHLKRAVTAGGIIVDSRGRPVPGATIAMSHIGGDGGGVMRTATNQVDGTFSVVGCTPGRTEIGVEATGFAMTTLETEIETNSPPIRVILLAGKPVRLRVQDKNGLPVPKASVALRAIGVPPLRGSQFDGQTDANGRLAWEHAPAQELTCRISALGYQPAQLRFQADEQEQVMALTPALTKSLTISGTVRDATNGQAISRFRIMAGLQTTNRFGITNMDWRTIPWMSFEGGRFLHTYRDLEPDSSVVFKFDAEAYAPFVTRVVGAGEGQVQFDVTLRPAHSITVTVLLPDGRPAASTDIGLVSPDVNLFLVPGGFRHPGRNQGYSESDIAARPLTTDDQGCFNLPDDPAITRVVVPHAEGYAEAPPVRLAVEPTMRLEPWSRLEGTMLSGGKPAVGRLLALTTGPDRAQLTLDPQDYSVETDADGRFVFPKVPPGRLQLRRSTRPRLAGSRADGFASLGSNAGAPRAGGFGSSGVFTIANPITEIEVRPGETKTVMLGAYTVTARVRWPANLQREANWLVGGNVVTPLPNPSATLVSAMPYMPYTSLVEAADGALVAEDLFAGSYEVRVLILDASGKLRAQAQVSMTVPADPPSGTLDLGEIVLQPPQ